MTTPIDDNTPDKSDKSVGTKQEESASAGTENTEHMIPKNRFNEVNNQLKDALKLIEENKKAREAAATQKLIDDKKWEQLYATSQQEIEPLKLLAEQGARSTERLASDNAARIEGIPDDKRSLIPKFDDPIMMAEWLTDNADLYVDPAKPRAPNLDGGAGGLSTSGDAITLTAKELDMAKNFGLTPEEYARGKVSDKEQSEFETNKG